MNCPSDEVHKALIANILFGKPTAGLVDGAGPDNLGGEDEVCGGSPVSVLLPVVILPGLPGHLTDPGLADVPHHPPLGLDSSDQEKYRRK